MVVSYTQCLRHVGSTHEDKAVVLPIATGDGDGLEDQSVQTANRMHQNEKRKEKKWHLQTESAARPRTNSMCTILNEDIYIVLPNCDSINF